MQNKLNLTKIQNIVSILTGIIPIVKPKELNLTQGRVIGKYFDMVF